MDKKTKKHLSYANGYRQLGMFEDAFAELDKVGEEFQGYKSIKVTRLAVHTDALDWDKVAGASQELAVEYPEDVEWRIQWAYALRRAESIVAARAILAEALEQFPKEACLHYNLGCYACLDGDHDRAKVWVQKALDLDQEGKFRKLALEDEDLEGIRGWLETL